MSSPKFSGVPVALMIAAAASALLAGCGNKEKSPTQVAAKVNKEEVSVHQINFVLQRMPRVTAETADAASRQILERLINQELAVQKAQELKLDRSPNTVQALEAARRDVLARAYLDSLADGVAKPSPEEVADFYLKKPALFKERKVYTFQDLSFTGTPQQIAEAQAKLQSTTSLEEAAGYLKTSGLKYVANLTTQAAENLPLQLLDRIAAMRVGQALVVPQPEGGGKVLLLAAVNPEPVDQAAALPAIEKFLLNDRKRLKTEAEMKSLRASAKVELMGKFAEGGASAPAAAAPATTTPPPAAAPAPVQAAPAVADVPAQPDPAASGLSSDAIRRGLTGIK